jgi:transposase-like protein
MNLFNLAKKFPTEEHALAYWMKTRWPDGVRCLACDHDKCYLIETKGKTGKVARLFECAACGLHFSATTNSLFHDSHLPLQKWFMAISLMVEAKKGISANQIKRHIGVTYKTAWYVCHRIRQAMQEDPSFTVGGPMTTVEIDETYVGGRNRLQGHKAMHRGKTAVLGLAERDGQIHMQKIKSIGLGLMREAIAQRLYSDTPHVVTDGRPLYKGVIPTIKHDRGNHKEELKDKNWTNTSASPLVRYDVA